MNKCSLLATLVPACLLQISPGNAQEEFAGSLVSGSPGGSRPRPATNVFEAAVRPAPQSVAPTVQPAQGGSSLPSTNASLPLLSAGTSAQPSAPVPPESERADIIGTEVRARFGSSQAAFAANANTMGAVRLSVPSRQGPLLMRSHVTGLCYYDYTTGEAVSFATLQDSVAQLFPPGMVIFTNALAGTDADIRYRWSTAAHSFEQDVILRKRLPDPHALGFKDLTTVMLAVMTEVEESPAPVRVADMVDLRSSNRALGVAGLDQLPCEDLFFGSMRLVGAGRAFLLGESGAEVPTAAMLHEVSGRSFIVESIPYMLIQAQVAVLPQGTLHAKAAPRGNIRSLMSRAAHAGQAKPADKPVLVAGLPTDTRPGLVLDYLMVSTPLLNVNFGRSTPPKTGFAAVGQSATDYWTPFYPPTSAISQLPWSDGTPSGVGITVSNAPGDWGWDSGDAMYSSYIYQDPEFGNITITITNLAANAYNLYLYGHAGRQAGNALFKLYRAGAQIGYKGTTLWGSGWNSTNWEAGQQYVVFKNVTVTNQTLQVVVPPGGDGYPYINGLQIVASAAVPPEPATILKLLNVDFAGASGAKIGRAATGLSDSDFWNGYWMPGTTAGTVVPLKYSDQTASPAGMTVLNAPGGWGSGSSDPMYSSYLYAWDAGNIVVTVTNLSPGSYDFFLYGHAAGDYANTVFQLWSGARECGVKATTPWGSGWNSAIWDEGQQYVVFRDVWVQEGQPITLVAGHDSGGYANLCGMQVALKGPADANANGLPDAWEQYYFGNLDHPAEEDLDGDGLGNLREYQLGLNPLKADSDGNGVPDAASCELAWLEDSTPTNAQLAAVAETWTWSSYYSAADGWGGTSVLPHSGAFMHISALAPGALHQHSFYSPDVNFLVQTGDVLYAYVNLDSSHIPDEVMLQWYIVDDAGHGSWEHRAYWGSNLIPGGTGGTVSRLSMGALPAAGTWIRLEVPASALGLEGRVIQGMAFSLWSGRAAWDRAGRFLPDMNGNGIPDWWEWKYFGSLQPGAGDFDNDGANNHEECAEGTDPNTISFNTFFAVDQVNADAVAGTIEVAAGMPAQMALLVDSTNFAAATWHPFSSSFLANLPPVDGPHDVWVGLRGLAADSQQTWDSTVITRDTTPPQLILTNPAVATSSQPMLQLQGFSPEPLANLSYDVANASGLITNLDGFVLHQHYDTNCHTLTTNFFQCFDIDLTNGENTVTLRATDLAGNVTVTNLTFTVVTDTVPPSVAIGWPRDGAALCGDTFTLDGFLDDPTATVTVSLLDANGDTQTLTATIERDGRFWAENLPLRPGTNLLALSATDVWGNSATTNLTVVRSQLQLSMFDVSPDELFQQASSVGGIVADPGCTIYVNGMPGRNNGDGTWSADNVPVTPGGTATFTVITYPAGHDLEESAARQIKPGVEKPPRLYVEEDTRDLNYSTCLRQDVVDGGPWTETHDQVNVGHDWRDGAGGPGWSMRDQHDLSSDPGAEQFNHCEGTIAYPASEWPVLLAGQWNVSPECFAFRYEDNPPIVGMEHCRVQDPTSTHWGPTPVLDIYDPWYGQMTVGSLDWTYDRTAQTTMKLFTGGKATVHRSNLFVVQGSASEVLDKRAVPPLQPNVRSRTIPPEEITVGALGKLGNDGRRYKVLPDGAPIDLTPKTSRKFYVFSVDAAKHRPRIQANGIDLNRQTPKFSVGQKIVLTTSFDPEPPGVVSVSAAWNLPGEYRNAKKYPFGTDYYVATCYPRHVWVAEQLPLGVLTPCTYYLIHAPLLYEESTGAWWISKGIKKVGSSKTVSFSNGQQVTAMFFGSFEILSPTVSISDILPRYFTGSWIGGVSLGDYSIQDGGMVYSVLFASDFSGIAAITQLIRADYSVGPNFPDHRLDGTEFYSQGRITPRSDPSSFKYVHFDDFPRTPGNRLKADFIDYVRFMPDGDDNIYATIATNHWAIHGEVTIYDTWTHRETPDPDGPTPSIDFPLWSHSYP